MIQLDINQIHDKLLAIARIVDGICNKHNIPLFMISGTMLGAIRHKGFIPWDDDMDFAVPYEQYNSMILFLQDELPANMRCVVFNTSETYCIPWIKVEDLDTMVYDNCLDIPKDKMPGLTIDIFPLVSCDRSSNESIVKKIQRLLTLQRVAYSVTPNNRLKNIVKKIIRFLMPVSAKTINKHIVELMDGIKPGAFYTIPVDPNYYSRYFPKEWFSPIAKYRFEDYELMGVKEYDSYLKELYHDYKLLPPVDKRRVHGDKTYLK